MQDSATTVMVLQTLRDIATQVKAVHGELQRLNQRLAALEEQATRRPSEPIAYRRPRLVPPSRAPRS